MGPTAARIVWLWPVVRWTSTPDSVIASITASICSSLAFSCIATIIASSLSPALLRLCRGPTSHSAPDSALWAAWAFLSDANSFLCKARITSMIRS